VRGRKYPWAAAYFHNKQFQCGGNLGRCIESSNLNEAVRTYNIPGKKLRMTVRTEANIFRTWYAQKF
jgi:hypothetical protein